MEEVILMEETSVTMLVGSSTVVGERYGQESLDSFSFEEILIANKFCGENLNLLEDTLLYLSKSIYIFNDFFCLLYHWLVLNFMVLFT